jgi:hypothetical protein
LSKSFRDKARLARQLSLSDWLILAEAWRLLLLFYLALRWVSYERIMPPACPTLESAPDSPAALVVAQRLQRLVGFASRLHAAPMTCLVKALALQKMLSGRDIPAQVRIGIHKTPAEIHAHAWVEIKGEAVGESQEVAAKFRILNPSGA